MTGDRWVLTPPTIISPSLTRLPELCITSDNLRGITVPRHVFSLLAASLTSLTLTGKGFLSISLAISKALHVLEYVPAHLTGAAHGITPCVRFTRVAC